MLFDKVKNLESASSLLISTWAYIQELHEGGNRDHRGLIRSPSRVHMTEAEQLGSNMTSYKCRLTSQIPSRSFSHDDGSTSGMFFRQAVRQPGADHKINVFLQYHMYMSVALDSNFTSMDYVTGSQQYLVKKNARFV